MRPILLHGHTRSLTKIKYNREGDLLFSCSKDATPSVWFSHNGERLGTFKGHNGAVWDLDVSRDSKQLLTASADCSLKLWDVYTGKELFTWTMKSAVRSCAFAEGDQEAVIVTDATMGQKSMLHIIKIADREEQQEIGDAWMSMMVPGSKATIARWSAVNETVLVGHEDGKLSVWDPVEGEMLRSIDLHKGQIQDIQFAKDFSFFITASKDNTSKVVHAETFEVLRTFTTDRPVNSAAISTLRPHIMIGGGQEAMSVTTTSAKQGKFEVRFFHVVFQDELGRVKGHFGPINTLAFHPDGRSFASGGEDGFVRVHFFDEDYFTFQYEEENFDFF